ncbi:MAG: hypothetical protein JWR16_2229 [Nevskia sp.]|nr:hypothetical protein [Nevskia sp.]
MSTLLPKPSFKLSFVGELQRRNVHRAAVFYAGAAWLLVQVATQVFPFFEIPNGTVRIVVIAVAIGFPFALLFSWFYEWTPQGIKRESEIDRSQSITQTTGKKLDRAIIAVLSLAVLLLLLNQFVLHRFMPGAASSVAPAAIEKSIAVLPFENLSDDKANAYFASGIQDEILTKLAGIGDLRVISRTSTEKYASRPDNLKTVAAELGVATLLEGSVQKSGGRVRVNVQLIKASSDSHLWANTYDRDLKDAFAVESEVSQDIADALKAKLSPSESSALAALPTQNAAAYDWFLKAEHANNDARKSEVEADFRRAEEAYHQAIALDPSFALAYARLAACALGRHWFIARLPAAELAQVKAEIDRAIALAPELPEAQVALGLYWYWGYRDYDQAVPAFQRALEHAPSNSDALTMLASIARRQGRWPQALAAFGKAAAIAPRDAVVVGAYGETYMVMRRYPEAEQWLSRALTIDLDSAEALNELFVIRLFIDGDADGARQLGDTLPAARHILFNYVGGEVMNLTGPWVYPDLYQRRYDDALKTWDAAPVDTPKQRRERLAARAAIMTLAHRQQEIQPECAQLKTLLEADAAAQPDEPLFLTGLSWAELCLGHKAEAVRAARRASELLPLAKDAYFGAYYLNGLAQIDAWAGQPDEALQLLAKLLAIPAGDYVSVQRLEHDPLWDPLRGDPRFRKLIADAEAASKIEAQP